MTSPDPIKSAHVDTFTSDGLPPRDLWPELIFRLPELNYPPRVNAAEYLLDKIIERHGPDRPCLRTDDSVWSYQDLLMRANQIAHVLVDDLGLVPGNRVLLRGPNNPWLVAAWFAVLKAGGVAVTTMPLLRAGELRVMAAKARVSLALCDHRFLGELVEASVPGLTVVPFGGTEADDLIALSTDKPAAFANIQTAADDVSLIAFTSGTTGDPKGCLHFHRDVLAIADTFSRHIVRPTVDDIFIVSPPMAFTFGLGGMVIFPLHAGASTVLLEKSTPELFAAAISRHQATICFTAPTAYRAILRRTDTDLASLRRCISAGEALPKATSDAWFTATGIRIIDGIGSTEMLHIFISAAEADIRPGATGKPVPGFEARVVDASGRPVPDGTTGRLVVRGPTGCRYLNDSRQSSYVRDGWNWTGDSYLADRDGYFWFQARTDDMIISSGYNIAGPEVEDALLRHPDVAEVAVVGVPDEDRGSVVKAYVVLNHGANRDEEAVRALQDFVKAQIAPYKYPRVIEFVEQLPRTATGKLQRFRLRQAQPSVQL
jgi:2-aminobenzoate-CoA ligase